MALFALITLILLEIVFLMWTLKTHILHTQEKAVANISVLILFSILVLLGVYQWSFRYYLLAIVLIVQAIISIKALVGKQEIAYKYKWIIICFTSKVVLLAFALALAIIFPQYTQPKSSGSYEVATAKVTWTDENRIDPYSSNHDNRTLTVEFWYPKLNQEHSPLIVFSHGAFGFSGSNTSTFVNLASNGYVVASISHTHQAFYTLDSDGKLTTVDTNFLSEATAINGNLDTTNQEPIYITTSEWMKIRTADMNFVLNSILKSSKEAPSSSFFSTIDPTKIGLFGHSLGGATAAQLGRDRSDIDGVIVLDGTMLGEEIGFENNHIIINEEPYPTPLLNIYAQDHYDNSKEYIGDDYNNFYATKNALNAYETVFLDAGHLNFTDLPLFSPLLAGILGVGEINSRECIEAMNEVVLEFFNSTLKDTGVPQIAKEY